MNDLSFGWSGSTSLADELSRPIKEVSLEFAPHGRPVFITLWRSDGAGLRLHSEMHDVAERVEVGVLNFEQVSAVRPNETIAGVSSAFQEEITVSKLVIHESGTSAECGVILKATNTEEIVIVPSANPYSLAIGGLQFFVPHIFEPEYPIDRYMRVRMI